LGTICAGNKFDATWVGSKFGDTAEGTFGTCDPPQPAITKSAMQTPKRRCLESNRLFTIAPFGECGQAKEKLPSAKLRVAI
jgi:hypothetical protein